MSLQQFQSSVEKTQHYNTSPLSYLQYRVVHSRSEIQMLPALCKGVSWLLQCLSGTIEESIRSCIYISHLDWTSLILLAMSCENSLSFTWFGPLVLVLLSSILVWNIFISEIFCWNIFLQVWDNLNTWAANRSSIASLERARSDLRLEMDDSQDCYQLLKDFSEESQLSAVAKLPELRVEVDELTEERDLLQAELQQLQSKLNGLGRWQWYRYSHVWFLRINPECRYYSY